MILLDSPALLRFDAIRSSALTPAESVDAEAAVPHVAGASHRLLETGIRAVVPQHVDRVPGTVPDLRTLVRGDPFSEEADEEDEQYFPQHGVATGAARAEDSLL